MGTVASMFDRIFVGDCMTVMEEWPSGFVDLVICDLPYGLTRNGWDKPIDLAALWLLYDRVVKENGAVILFGLGAFTARLILSNVSAFRYKLVWIKMKPSNFLNVARQPLRKHEDICVFYRKQPVFRPQLQKGRPYDKGSDKGKVSGNYGGYRARRKRNRSGWRNPSDVLFLEEDQELDWWYGQTPTVAGKLFHPTQKPVELCRYLVRTYTDPGAVVLDNACGSGSALVAAVLEGRHYVGVELLRDYVEVSCRRLEAAAKEGYDSSRQILLFR
jgi:site-specific DNA-methyltransferase (adenine-specific)